MYSHKSAADVKMEIPVLVRSLKTSILSATSLQMDKTFWGVTSAAGEQSRCKANMVARGDGKFSPWGWLQNPPNQKKKCICTNFIKTPKKLIVVKKKEKKLKRLHCKKIVFTDTIVFPQKYGRDSVPFRLAHYCTCTCLVCSRWIAMNLTELFTILEPENPVIENLM